MDNVSRQVRETIVDHEPAGVLPRHYSIQVVNPVLQSFEQDSFNLALGFDVNEVSVMNYSEFNSYSPQLAADRYGNVVVKLFAQRRKVQIPSTALSGALNKTPDGFSGQLTIDPNYLPQNDPGSKLMLYYELCSNWFLGCRTLNETRATVEVDSPQMLVNIDGAFVHRQDYRIRYRFYRTSSRYYSSTPTEGLTEKKDF